MTIVEGVIDEGPSYIQDSSSDVEFARVVRQLSARLALPEDLLPTFMQRDKPADRLAAYHDHAKAILKQVQANADEGNWNRLPFNEQCEVVLDVARLYGEDDWTSPEILEDIDYLLSSLPKPIIAHHILANPLRQIFSPSSHPMLNPASSRAFSRPHGGPEAQSDFQDSSTQTFKLPPNWGCHNILIWCCAQLPPSEVEKYINVILPPTLVLMDDWEPGWRGLGVRVLKSWVGKMDVVMMKRMGMDRLLVDSLVHTLSLHANPPLEGVLEVALDLVERTTGGEKRAGRYAEIMEKGIVNGWTYAPSGLEGRPVLINIAKEVEVLCDTLGEGIVRWLKVIIPNLLDPLQFTPTSAVLTHYQANLSALLCVMTTCASTSRIHRWRGQILDITCRLWVQLREQSGLEGIDDDAERLRELMKVVFAELGRQCPQIANVELKQLQMLDSSVFTAILPSIEVV